MKMNREIVNISLNRDAVCMVDDINDHREIVFVPADMTVKDFVRTACLNYLKDGSVWMGDWLVYSGDLDSGGLGELLFCSSRSIRSIPVPSNSSKSVTGR